MFTPRMIADMFKVKGRDVSLQVFSAEMKKQGINCREDPRLMDMMSALEGRTTTRLVIDSSEIVDSRVFERVITPYLQLISKTLEKRLVIVDFENMVKDLKYIFNVCKKDKTGAIATYTPQLATVHPDLWGISVCSTDGQMYSEGDYNVSFTIHACCHPLVYALALEVLGINKVHRYVSAEPIKRPTSALTLGPKPEARNPMLNSGAAVVCSLLEAHFKENSYNNNKHENVIRFIQRLSGNQEVTFNKQVYQYERDTNFRKTRYQKNVANDQDFYYQCTSFNVTCSMLSVVAATLANGGLCPLTNEQVLKPEVVNEVLSAMKTKGMCDYSSEFAVQIGLPAKSSLTGAIMVVIPNKFGYCTFAPRLDLTGNSAKGVYFTKELIKKYNFHNGGRPLTAVNRRKPARTHLNETQEKHKMKISPKRYEFKRSTL